VLLAELKRIFATQKRGQVVLGVGDDAAVLRAPVGKVVLSVDAAIEGVHFKRPWLTLTQLGARCLHAAASDLAAMGAKPSSCVCHVTLTPGFTSAELRRLALGQARAADEIGCPVVGGNLSRGSELSVVTTVVGSVGKPLARSGARVGDEIWLVGELGAAAAGLRLLELRSGRLAKGSPGGQCVRAWREPKALVTQGLGLASCAHAVIDVSDGLGIDAERLATASAKRLVFDEAELLEALPIALLSLCRQRGWEALPLALEGGEDYALLAAGPRSQRPAWARKVGAVTRGRGAYVSLRNGERRRLGTGYDHFVADGPVTGKR
jgi:thiamine-monophosphate kinase